MTVIKIAAAVTALVVGLFLSNFLSQNVGDRVTDQEAAYQKQVANLVSLETETVFPRAGETISTYWERSGFSKDYSLPIFEEAVRKLNPELPVLPRDDKPFIIPKKR